jgi:hypothetical protein
MPDYTLQDVFDQARSLCADNLQVPTGELFPNAVLQPFFNQAWRRMWSAMMGNSKRVSRTVYLVLPANTTQLDPRTFGITDLNSPEYIEEREAPAMLPITGTSGAVGQFINVNIPNHGLSTGAMVDIYNTSGTTAPWGRWMITVTDANNFLLNGSYSDGVAGTGGTAVLQSVMSFTGIAIVDKLPDQFPPQVALGYTMWENQVFKFNGASEAREIRLSYWSSGTPITTPNMDLGVDNCIDFLANATIGWACRSKGYTAMADSFLQTAFGPDGDSGRSGLLGLFMNIQVLVLQATPRRPRPFREPRSRWGNYVMCGA